MKDDGAGANVKGQHAGCPASGQPLTAAPRKTLFSMSGLSRRSLPTGEGRSGQRLDLSIIQKNSLFLTFFSYCGLSNIVLLISISYDANSGEFIIHFMLSDDSPLDTAIINLSSESGEIVFQDKEKWSIKFSEKNDELFMTINDKADGSGVTVYYEDV